MKNSGEKRALFVTTTASMIAQFNRENIKILQKLGYEVHIACNFQDGNTTSIEFTNEFRKEIQNIGVKIFNVPFTRTPFAYGKNLKIAIKLRKIIKKYKYKIIHCQTPVGGVVARIAATLNIHGWGGRIIYTAHGFHFFYGAPKRNWLLFYPIERELSRVTDTLITINTEDYKRAQKDFHAAQVKYVPGIGIDVKKYRQDKSIGEAKRKELNVKDDDIMLLSVGELSCRKNHAIVIEALSKIKHNNIKYYIVGKGEIGKRIEKKIKEYNLSESVFLLGYRTDIEELCNAADLFVFPSLQEGLPVSLMEAMACRIPAIVSNIRGNTDLIKNLKYLFNPKDEDELISKLLGLIGKTANRKYLRESTRGDVELNYANLAMFTKENVNNIMTEIYKNASV